MLNEAAVLAVLTGESLTSTQEQQIINRYDPKLLFYRFLEESKYYIYSPPFSFLFSFPHRNVEYLEALIELGADEGMVLNVGNSVITTSSNILDQSPNEQVFCFMK